MEKSEFRQALGQFATGVCIVSIYGEDMPLGLTINSFASVSLDPALVLWSLWKASNRYGQFSAATQFGISVLSASQEGISRHFAGQQHAPPPSFDRDYPLKIEECAAFFLCEAHQDHDAGDHLVRVGRVTHFSQTAHQGALIYYSGRYGVLS